jgi:hypothetical protein
MQPCSAWVGKHIEHVILWFVGIVLRSEGFMFCPILLPLLFDVLRIVFHIANNEGAKITKIGN